MASTGAPYTVYGAHCEGDVLDARLYKAGDADEGSRDGLNWYFYSPRR